jgi:hypothetical protein
MKAGSEPSLLGAGYRPLGRPIIFGLAAALLGGIWISASERPTVVSSLATDDLRDFKKNDPSVRRLIERSLELTSRSLGYQMGSADPASGGLDCSGTIHWLLKASGVDDVPRSSHEQYRWVWEKGTFRAVNGRSFASAEFSKLKPGDLLFWTGTYAGAAARDPPISHVMIYLGELETDGRKVMFGASEGRPFGGKPQCGVSVFDFVLPSAKSEARFVGYASVPGL